MQTAQNDLIGERLYWPPEQPAVAARRRADAAASPTMRKQCQTIFARRWHTSSTRSRLFERHSIHPSHFIERHRGL